VIDPFSWGGLIRVFRHRIRRYPAVILAGRERFIGWAAESDLLARLNELVIRA
jgi:hypothetical protein